MSSKKMIMLKSSDGEEFQIEEAVAIQSETLKHMIEDDCANTEIPLANVNSQTLAKVIEFCKKHVVVVDDSNDETKKKEEEEEVKKWDAEFMELDQGMLFNLILAANFLNIKDLLDLGCQTVADMIKGKTPEQIRETFNIENDFTPEEEEAVRNENQWAFE